MGESRPLVHELPPSPQQRLRQKRKGEGWKQYEGWLSPEALAIIEREQHPHEPLNDTINRLLTGVPRVPSEIPSDFRSVPHWTEDLRALVREELTALTRQADTPPAVPVPSAIPSEIPRAGSGDYAGRKAEVLRRLRAMKAEGLSLQAMATQLNADGIPTLSGRGTWQKGTVGNLLTAD